MNHSEGQAQFFIATNYSKVRPGGLFPVAQRWLAEMEKFGFPGQAIFCDVDQWIEHEENSLEIFGEGREESLVIQPKFALIFVRIDADLTANGRELLRLLETRGALMVNDAKSRETCSSKRVSDQLFREAGLPTPPTLILERGDTLKARVFFEQHGTTVLKTLTGSKGLGVTRIQEKTDLTAMVEGVLRHRKRVLLQKYIDADRDVRTLVLNGEIQGTMIREAADGDFRANISIGASGRSYQLSKNEEKLVLEAAEVTGSFFCGVDHLVDREDNMLLLEVNTSPMLDGIESVLGRNLIFPVLRQAYQCWQQRQLSPSPSDHV